MVLQIEIISMFVRDKYLTAEGRTVGHLKHSVVYESERHLQISVGLVKVEVVMLKKIMTKMIIATIINSINYHLLTVKI